MIFIAADHFGVETAEAVIAHCGSRDLQAINLGARSSDDVLSLGEMIPRLVDAVRADPDSTGVLICGTGAGVEIGANRFSGIRASLCSSPQFATWARQYDNANVLCLSGWATPTDEVGSIIDAWLDTDFDGDDGRTAMLQTFDSWSGK